MPLARCQEITGFVGFYGREKPDRNFLPGTEWTVERAAMGGPFPGTHTWRDAGNRTPRDIPLEGWHHMTAVRVRPETEALLTPSEVATLFRVDPKTVTRWAKAGKLTSIRTLGGHRRYRENEVRSLLEGNTAPVEA